MDKLIWGSSQAITSAYFFLIQLSFLKSNNLGDMAEFSILFGLMNFVLLMLRRSMIEIVDLTATLPSISFFILLTFLFFGITLPITFATNGNILILINVSIFLFNQIIFDILRFSNNRSHTWYLVLQTFSIILIFGATRMGLNAVRQLLLVTVFQLIGSVLYLSQDKRKKIKIKQTVSHMNLTRLSDFVVNSGFGFILPLLTVLILDQKSVGILRTSQNFLNLGSIFTAAFYYSSLRENKVTSYFKISYFLPSLILIGIVLFSDLIVNENVSRQIFGPYFQQSLLLTNLLILALVPTMWVSRLNAIMVKTRKYSSLFRIHLISLSVLAISSIGGFFFFGIEAFGLGTIFCSCLEIILVRRTLRSKSD